MPGSTTQRGRAPPPGRQVPLQPCPGRRHRPVLHRRRRADRTGTRIRVIPLPLKRAVVGQPFHVLRHVEPAGGIAIAGRQGELVQSGWRQAKLGRLADLGAGLDRALERSRCRRRPPTGTPVGPSRPSARSIHTAGLIADSAAIAAEDGGGVLRRRSSPGPCCARSSATWCRGPWSRCPTSYRRCGCRHPRSPGRVRSRTHSFSSRWLPSRQSSHRRSPARAARTHRGPACPFSSSGSKSLSTPTTDSARPAVALS